MSFIYLFEHQVFLLGKERKGDMWCVVGFLMLDVMERNDSIALAIHGSFIVLCVYQIILIYIVD